MAISNLLPWRKGEKKVPVRRDDDIQNPFYALQRNVNRLFDDLFDEMDLQPFGPLSEDFGVFNPRVDMSETDDEIKVVAELPGLNEDDFEISLTHNLLSIRGEKKAEKEEKGKNFYRVERSYGAFNRHLPLPCEVQVDKVEATFKKGVLTVTLPKTPEAKARTKKIAVRKV